MQSALTMVDAGEQTLIGSKLWEAFGPTSREEVEKTTQKLRSDPGAERHELTFDLTNVGDAANSVTAPTNVAGA